MQSLKIILQAKSLDHGFQVVNSIDHHTILVDEPKNAGGTDLGPNPTQLFLSAIASSIIITAEALSRQANIQICQLEIELEALTDREHVTVLQNSFTEISYNLSMDSSLNAQETEAFIKKIEDNCPILQTLSRPVIIKRPNPNPSV